MAMVEKDSSLENGLYCFSKKSSEVLKAGQGWYKRLQKKTSE